MSEVVSPEESSVEIEKSPEAQEGLDTRADIQSALNPTMEEVSGRLDRLFRRWRQRRCGELFDYEKDPRKRANYIRHAGKMGYEPNGANEMFFLPRQDYYEIRIAPTLLAMAESPQHLAELGVLSIECLDNLMMSTFNTRGRSSTKGSLVGNFFRYINLDEGGLYKEGQFQYFYQKYGPDGVRAIARMQGCVSDRYFDSMDGSNSVRKVEEYLDPILALIPGSAHSDFFAALAQFSDGAGVENILEEMPPVFERLKDHPYVFDYYFKLLLAEGEWASYDHAFLRNPEELKQQLGALHAHPQKKAMFEMAVGLMELETHSKPIFDTSDDTRTGRTMSHITVHRYVKELSEAGYTPKQIEKIATIPAKNPWLVDAADNFLSLYVELDAKFPGGAEACLAYLKRLKDAGATRLCMLGTITNLGELKSYPKDKIGPYLELGVELVEILGDDGAYPYFKAPWSEGAHFMRKMIKDPEGWREKLLEAANYALQFPTEKELMAGDSRGYVFLNYGFFIDDPNFANLKEGMDLILEKWLGAFSGILGQGNLKPYEIRRKEKDINIIMVKMLHHFFFPHPHPEHRDLPMPGEASFLTRAKIITHWTIDEGDFQMSKFEEYSSTVYEGIDWQIAAHIKPILEGEAAGGYEVTRIPGIAIPVSEEKLQMLAGLVIKAKNAMAAVTKTDPVDADDAVKDVKRLSKNEALAQVDLSKTEALRAVSKEIEAIQNDPELGRYVNFEKLQEKIRTLAHLALFRDMGDIGIKIGRSDIDRTPLMATTNATTQSIIGAMSFVASLGGQRVEGVNDDIEPLVPDMRMIPDSTKAGELSDFYKGNMRQIISNINQVMPRVHNLIMEARTRIPGLVPVGLKIHTPQSMNQTVVSLVRDAMGIGNTPFKLIHAGETLVLDPTVSAFEMQLMVFVLQTFGVIPEDDPDMQTTGVGRWSDEKAGIAGASMLLSTTRGSQFAPGAFATSHNSQTGGRIMVKDAGAKNVIMPFGMNDVAEGRVDKLGNRIHTDISRYQVLSTLMAHAEYGGIFEKEAQEFISMFKRILEKYDLVKPFCQSAWLYGNAEDGDSLDNHESMIRAFTEAWKRAANSPDKGIINEMHKLINYTTRKMAARKEEVKNTHHDEYQAMLAY